MTRTQVLLLSLAAVLLTAFSVALSRRDSRDWRANRARRLLPFPWQETAGVAVTRPDGSGFEFFRDEGGQWKIRLDHGLSDNLNPNTVEAMAALATLAWREGQPGRPAPARDEAIVLSAVDTSGQRVEILLGDTRQNLRAAVIDGDDGGVYGVNQDLLAFIDWPARRHRSMLLAAVEGGRAPWKIRLSPRGDDADLDIHLERGEDGWFMTSPVRWQADESRLDGIIRWLDRLRAESVAAEMSGDLKFFGFAPESPAVEAWYDTPSGEIHRRVEFGGDAGGDRIYAREASRTPIFALAGEALSEEELDQASRNPAAWRNRFRSRNLDRLGPDTPETIVVEQLLPEHVTLTITQFVDSGGMRWRGRLERDGAAPEEFDIDSPDGKNKFLPLTALLTGLSNLAVKTFLLDEAPGPENADQLTHPAWRFAMRTRDGRDLPGLTLYAANAQGDLPAGVPFVNGKADFQKLEAMAGLPANAGIVFTVPDREAVLETYGEMAYLLCLPPYRYRSRRLLADNPGEWSRLEVRSRGGDGDEKTTVYIRKPGEVNEQWWRGDTPGEPLMDGNNRFVGMTLELSQLRTDDFVQDASGDVAKFGLDQPEITAIVYRSPEGGGTDSSPERLFKLSLGDEADASGRRYALLNDGGPVFLAPAELCRALDDEYR